MQFKLFWRTKYASKVLLLAAHTSRLVTTVRFEDSAKKEVHIAQRNHVHLQEVTLRSLFQNKTRYFIINRGERDVCDAKLNLLQGKPAKTEKKAKRVLMTRPFECYDATAQVCEWFYARSSNRLVNIIKLFSEYLLCSSPSSVEVRRFAGEAPCGGVYVGATMICVSLFIYFTFLLCVRIIVSYVLSCVEWSTHFLRNDYIVNCCFVYLFRLRLSFTSRPFLRTLHTIIKFIVGINSIYARLCACYNCD